MRARVRVADMSATFSGKSGNDRIMRSKVREPRPVLTGVDFAIEVVAQFACRGKQVSTCSSIPPSGHLKHDRLAQIANHRAAEPQRSHTTTKL